MYKSIAIFNINILYYEGGDNTIKSFMSTLPVAIYTDTLKQKGDIFKKNNKKSGIYR